MKRLIFYIFSFISDIFRGFSLKKHALLMITYAHKTQGVKFEGNPKYIHRNTILDPLGGLTIHNGVVISTGVTILTHDYSCTVGLSANGNNPVEDIALFDPVSIGESSFIGANATILPGSQIGKYCIIGAGTLLKGKVEDYSIIIGNPAKIMGDTRKWGEKLLQRFPVEKIHHDNS